MCDVEILSRLGTKVCISDNIRFSRDPLLLASFAGVRERESILDIGAGSGIITFALRDAGHEGRAVALELDGEACELMARSVGINDAQNIEIVRGDLREFRTTAKFDVALCNPPYFKFGAGKLNSDAQSRSARSESTCTADDVAACAVRSLKEGGRLVICCRTERLAELICLFERRSLELKRLQFVKHTRGGQPWLALLEARYRAGTGLVILPDLIDN
ncbi:MAG: methyltransferase [Oscillospiraceae bacterium]